MNSITQVKRCLPHEITTKVGAVKLYRETKDIGYCEYKPFGTNKKTQGGDKRSCQRQL